MIKVTDGLVGKFLIIDDVNSENKEFVKNFHSKATLHIDKRFETPPTNYSVQGVMGSDTYRYIASAVGAIGDLVKQGKTNIVQGETPFNNFKIKINYWCTVVFAEVLSRLDTKEETKIIIDHEITKHEFIFMYWLYKCGANILVITKNISKAGSIHDDVQVTKCGTNENLEYREDVIANTAIVVKKSELKSISDIESALYNKNSIVRILVDGVGNYIDTCDFYGRLYINSESNSDFKLLINGFEVPSQIEVNKVPRFKRDEHNYILQTLMMFVNIGDKERLVKLKDSIITEFNSGVNKDLKGTILYNKLLYNILVLNKLLDSSVKHIVFYGEANKNDISILRILWRLEFVSIIILMPDKSKVVPELLEVYDRIELESSIENLEMPKVDSRDNAKTTGAVASRIAQETLYNGDLLGMYKPGQFITCNTKLFSTAYEEIELWWNKEMYNRPGFGAKGITAELPVMFKVINGVPKSMDHATYLYCTDLISKFLYGNTLLCKNVSELDNFVEPRMRILRGTDINGTDFASQKPFFTNGKIHKDRVKNCINYGYGYLSIPKQDFILNKIEEVLNSDLIEHESGEKFVDSILNILLNLSSDFIRMIQWFEFYTDNPNLVLVMPDEHMLSIENVAMLLFMHLIGFDVLIFVPTRYRALEGLVSTKFQYDKHEIGYAEYNIDTQYLKVDQNRPVNEDSIETGQKKKTFISKLLDAFT